MKKAFISYLGTDSFLPGILALKCSLKKHSPAYDMVILATEFVSKSCIGELYRNGMEVRVIKDIKNPHDLGADERGFRYMYTKLRLFELDEFDKIVYLDADMIVCRNIEQLFEAPHMSASVAGGFIPSNSSWKDLNAGLLVVEPDKTLFNKMNSVIAQMPSVDGSDQGFLQSFYPGWPKEPHLHLDHAFNVPLCYLDEYCQSGCYNFEYKRRSLNTNIAIIHYWGKYKPWHINQISLNRKTTEKWEQALLLWWDVFNTCPADL